MLKHNGHRAVILFFFFFFFFFFFTPYTSATCITINLMATLRSLISDGPLSQPPLEQWPRLCPSTSPQSANQTAVANGALGAAVSGTRPSSQQNEAVRGVLSCVHSATCEGHDLWPVWADTSNRQCNTWTSGHSVLLERIVRHWLVKGFSQHKLKYDPTYIPAYNTARHYITAIFIIQSNPEVWFFFNLYF